MGLAMLSIGMVASFLTPNLTVSFILGMLFNAIPVMTYYADVLVPASATARQISQWSFAAQFDDFGRGVISLSSIGVLRADHRAGHLPEHGADRQAALAAARREPACPSAARSQALAGLIIARAVADRPGVWRPMLAGASRARSRC